MPMTFPFDLATINKEFFERSKTRKKRQISPGELASSACFDKNSVSSVTVLKKSATSFASLENAGLITLSHDVEFATVADIVDNPKKLQIIEMDQAQTVTALEDMAAACCWFTHMAASRKDPSSYIVRDDVMVNYPMGVIAKGDNAVSDWAVAMAECLRDPEVQAKINEAFPNVFEFYTSDDQVKE